MRIQLDTDDKVIWIDKLSTLGELLDTIKDLLSEDKWRNYQIRIETPTKKYVYEPISWERLHRYDNWVMK